ncbi:right-handed parallel beta-helix repeat-containing protein [Cytophagaceae bacterium ABcell3]|nr:right-handed parallel beta-helix repeat-containing protein [Cytophagaceae bacterium ABcell3]
MKKYLIFFCFIVFFHFSYGQEIVSVTNSLEASLVGAIEHVDAGGTVMIIGSHEIKLTQQVVIDKPLTILAASPDVIIRAGDAMGDEQHIFVIETDDVSIVNVELSGATGTSGQACGEEVSEGGVGVLVRQGVKNTTIENCYIHSNASHGIYFEGDNDEVDIINCVVSDNCNDGIRVNDATNVKVAGCKIGTNREGDEAYGNYWDGIVFNRSENFVLENSIISGNGEELSFAGNVGRGIRVYETEEGSIGANYIGTDLTGMSRIGNRSHGIFIEGDGDETDVANGIVMADNIIAGNGTAGAGEGHGVFLKGASIRGTFYRNYIGLNSAGEDIIANNGNGIHIELSDRNIIGNYRYNRNVIGGNDYGIYIDDYPDCGRNRIVHNFIGTDVSGTEAKPNRRSGMYLSGRRCGNEPGDISLVSDNVVSRNQMHGIEGNNLSAIIEKNIIGLQEGGSGFLGNNKRGIYLSGAVSSSLNDNTVSGNFTNGVEIIESSDIDICSNRIGVDNEGEPLPNGGSGLVIRNSSNVHIGYSSNAGPDDYSLCSNTISANQLHGIRIENSSDNIILDNVIGGGSETNSLGNGVNGIMIQGQSQNNIIGRFSELYERSAGNEISYNARSAIAVLGEAAFNNRISHNQIFCNGYGTDLDETGNNNFSMPLTAPTVDWHEKTISGLAEPESFIEIYKVQPDCDDCQGWKLIGEERASATGEWSFSYQELEGDGSYTFTASDQMAGQAGNTSEFSPCGMVLPVDFLSFEASPKEGYVELLWSTASEKDNDRFEVEFSKDGDFFEKIGQVDGAGSSASIEEYSFDHHGVRHSEVFYRLKQVDYNGAYSYSPVRRVVLEVAVNIYPNPVSDIVHIHGSFDHENVQIDIFNALGVHVLSENISGVSEEIQVPVHKLKPGIYYLEVSEEAKTPEALKFIKK